MLFEFDKYNHNWFHHPTIRGYSQSFLLRACNKKSGLRYLGNKIYQEFAGVKRTRFSIPFQMQYEFYSSDKTCKKHETPIKKVQVQPRWLAWILCLLFSSASSSSGHYQAKRIKPRKRKKSLLIHDIAFLSTFELISFVQDFAIFFQGATTTAHTKERTSRACEKAVRGFQ